jgi:hypothetical protein
VVDQASSNYTLFENVCIEDPRPILPSFSVLAADRRYCCRATLLFPLCFCTSTIKESSPNRSNRRSQGSVECEALWIVALSFLVVESMNDEVSCWDFWPRRGFGSPEDMEPTQRMRNWLFENRVVPSGWTTNRHHPRAAYVDLPFSTLTKPRCEPSQSTKRLLAR